MPAIPPIPIRSRNQGVDAHLANARVAIGVEAKTVLAFIVIVTCLIILLFVLK